MFGVNLTWYLWARNECLQKQCRRSVVAKQMLQKMSTSPKFNQFRALQVKISIFLLSNKQTDWKKMRVFSLENQLFYLYDKKCEQICISLIGAPFHRFTVSFFSTPINLTLQFRRSHWMFCWNANSHRHSKIEFVLVTSEFLAPQRAESWQKLRFNLFLTCVFFRQSFDLINELDILFGSCE